MNYNAEQVIKLAKDFLIKDKIEFIESIPFRARYVENEKLRDGIIIPVWVVAYEYMVFEEEVAFIRISDLTGEILYITDKHSYIENDGSR